MADVDVAEIIDRSRFGRLQTVVLTLSTMCMIVDGFDVQAMGYAAPALIHQWDITKAELGPVFGAGLFGMALGALVLGSLADRLGRRPVLIGAMFMLAAFTLATSFASSVYQMLALRFVAGLAMGAIVPNAVALAGEFSPVRIRVTLMMTVSAGFVLGGAAGGVIAAVLTPTFGWPSVFIVGAAIPLVLATLMLALLPESLQFLAVHNRAPERIHSYLRQIDPDLCQAGTTRFVLGGPHRATGVPIFQLFRDGMGLATLLLWLINFMNLLAAYFVANWLPVIMSEAGHSAAAAVLAGSALWTGGLAGTLILGWCVDRHGFGSTFALNFLAGTIAMAAIGLVAPTLSLAFIVIAVVGFCILGGQSALNALAASVYPTPIRSTGMGWAMGVGRFGSIMGPVIGGGLMHLNWGPAYLLLAASLPCLAALLGHLIFWACGRLPRSAGQKSLVLSTHETASI